MSGAELRRGLKEEPTSIPAPTDNVLATSRLPPRIACAGLFLIGVVEPSALAADKYFGTAGLAVLILVGAVVALGIMPWSEWLFARLSTRTAACCLLLALLGILAVSLLVYPRANVHTAMHGSDRDDALFDATSALLHGHFPYGRPTYLGNPITPLPGALILAIPFVLLGNVGLANVFWSGAMAGALWLWRGDPRPAGLALILPLLSPEVMHEVATGGDMFANGIYVGMFLLAAAIILPRRDAAPLTKVGIAALLGIGLSSRPTYWMVLPALYGYLTRQLGARVAFVWTGISVAVLIAVTAPFYFASPSRFAPFHLATKLTYTGGLIPHANAIVPVLTMTVSLACLLLPLSAPRSLLVAAAAVVGFPTYLLAVANLSAGQRHLSLEYFSAGLSATGLCALALGGFLPVGGSTPTEDAASRPR